MYILLILLAIFIPALFLAIKTEKECWLNVCMGSFILLFIWLPGVLMGMSKTINLTEKYVIPIMQFKEHDTSVLHGGGSFLGWSMNGGTKLQYVVIEQREYGMIRTFHDQDNTWIKEVNDNPRIEYRCYKEYYSKWFTMPWCWKKNDDVLYYNTQPTIFVPKDTVQIKFDNL